MAIYLSMFIEDKTAVDIPDNITTSFKITPKRNKQLPFPVILISKSAVNIELTLHPIAMSMLMERIVMRKQERFFHNCEDFK